MASPLSIFRKYQYLLLVAFGIMLMFAFVIAPPLDSYLRDVSQVGGGGNPVVVEWQYGKVHEAELASMRTRHLLTMRFLQALVSRIEVQEPVTVELGGRKVQLIKGRSYPYAGEGRDAEGNPTFQIVVQGQIVEVPQSAAEPIRPRATMIPWANSERDLMQRILLARRAEQMGIVISDDAILDYFDRLADATPSQRPDYVALLDRATNGRLPLRQLMAQMAFELSAQRMLMMSQSGITTLPPEKLFQLFNRMNRRITAELLPVPVTDFLDQTPAPSEQEVRALYEEAKDRFPDPGAPEPGFKRRKRIAFAFVAADIDAYLEQEKARLREAVTDEEIEKYYQDNKETEFKIPELPPAEPEADQGDTEAAPPPAKDAQPPAQPAADEPADDTKPVPQKKKPAVPAEKPAAPATKPDTSAKKPAAPPAEKSDAPPADSPAADPEPPARKPDASPQKADKPAKKAGEPTTSDSTRPVGHGQLELVATLVSFQDDAPALEPPTNKKADPAPASEPKAKSEAGPAKSTAEAGPKPEPKPKAESQSKPKAEPKAKAESEPEPKAKSEPESQPQPAAEPKSKSEPKTPSESKAEVKPETAPEPSGKPAAKPQGEPKPQAQPEGKPAAEPKAEAQPKGKPEPRYRPLDDALRAEIRDRLAEEKARPIAEQQMEEALEAARAAVEDHARQLVRAELLDTVETPPPLDISALAAENRLTYGRTPLLDIVEVFEIQGAEPAEDDPAYYDFLRATETAFDQQAGMVRRTIANLGFAGDLERYTPRRLVDGFVSESFPIPPERVFLYWRVEQEPERVPELEEVRASVVTAWRLRKALPLAEAEAEQLAERARQQAEQPLTESLSGQADKVIKTDEFSWMTRGSTPVGGGGRPMLSVVRGTRTAATADSAQAPDDAQSVPQPVTLEHAGQQFMETVFGLQVGEFGTARNDPETVVYVVRIAGEAMPESQRRELFFASGLTMDVGALLRDEQARLIRSWYDSLEQQYQVNWLREPTTWDRTQS